jgi:hypothetical protein
MMSQYTMRLERIETRARDRYIATSDRKFILAARAIKAKRKMVAHREFLFRKLHWIDAKWPTSFDTVLETARDKNLRMLSIDTEVDWNESNRNIAALREVGLTTYEDGELITRHYVLDGLDVHSKFRYGESIAITMDDLRPIVVRALDRAEMIMTFQEQVEIKAFRQFLGLEIPREKRLDMAFWKEVSPGQSYNLMGLANAHGIWHPAAHNAGNDSHVLMTTVLAALGMREVEPDSRYVPKQPKGTFHNSPPRHGQHAEQYGS